MSDDERLDRFGDIIYSRDGSGIFADSALGAHDSARSQPSEDGLVIEYECEGCPKPKQLVVSWPEVIAMRYQLSPHIAWAQVRMPPDAKMAWSFDQAAQGWRPADRSMLYCECGFRSRVLLTQDDTERFLKKWRQRSDLHTKFTPEHEQALSNIAAKVAASMPRR